MFEVDWQHIVGLFVLAIPIACIARTVVFEEIFREPREWCQNKSKNCSRLLQRKFYYLFTCEYCFSHYVTVFFLFVTHFTLMYTDWRGYLISFFSLVFVANAYLNLYGRMRVEITHEKKEIESKVKEIEVQSKEVEAKDREIRKLDAELGRCLASEVSPPERNSNVTPPGRAEGRDDNHFNESQGASAAGGLGAGAGRAVDGGKSVGTAGG